MSGLPFCVESLTVPTLRSSPWFSMPSAVPRYPEPDLLPLYLLMRAVWDANTRDGCSSVGLDDWALPSKNELPPYWSWLCLFVIFIVELLRAAA